MSDSRDAELLEGRPLAVEVSSSDSSPEPVQSPESPDGFVHVESSADVIEADLGGSRNQDLGSSHRDEDDPRETEDAVKDDMFVDCPDELVGNSDSKEAASEVEIGEDSKEIHNLHDVNESRDVLPAANEVDHLRALLDEAVLEKERLSREFEAERLAIYRETSGLRHQLRGLVNREELHGEIGGEEDSTIVSLSDLMIECSMIIQNACSERELQAASLAQSQEVEVVTDRLLAYYSGVVDQQELFDDSVSGKLGFVERGTYMLAERYNMMLYEIDQLRASFSEATLDLASQDLGTFFAAARGEVLGLKRKEFEFVERLSHLEDENRKLVHQSDEQRMMVESLSAELGKTKADLELKTTQWSNTKEKLSMAITKGKALVQEKHGLKQSLAETTGVLKKCKDQLLESDNLVASLQQELFKRNSVLEKLEGMMSESSVPEEVLSADFVDRYKWVIEENNELKGLSQEYQRAKNALSIVLLPENVSSAELESQVHWVTESLYQARSDLNALNDDFIATKNHLQMDLNVLSGKYEEIVDKEHQLTLEKDRAVKLLLEASEVTSIDTEDLRQSSSEMITLIERFLEKRKEQTCSSSGSPNVDIELFEKFQSYLYVMCQEMVLCKLLLEDEMSLRSETGKISEELKAVSQELEAVKEEKESLRNKLERAEERSGLVSEKLSMAVKKGKGLFQERNNLKAQLEEKNLEIKKQESEIAGHIDQIARHSSDIERIPGLEMNLAEIKQQRDQFEGFLLESNDVLQRLIVAIDGISLPVDAVFEEPVEKVKYFAEYIIKTQDAKAFVENELVTLKDELSEAGDTIKALEHSLTLAEEKFARLSEDKTEIEIAKDSLEQELQKAREESSLHSGKFEEVTESRRSLEEALSRAENNIQAIIGEKEGAELELERVREEITKQSSKLTDAYQTIHSLEEELSQLQTSVTLLTEQNGDAQLQRTNAENDLRKLQDDAESNSTQLAEAGIKVKSLEDALLAAENSVSVLQQERKSAEEEISTLNSKLSVYLEESTTTTGSVESRSIELSGYLGDLQVLMNDETLFSAFKEFESKFDSLGNAFEILGHIRDRFSGSGLEQLQIHHAMEDDHGTKFIPENLAPAQNFETDDNDVSVEDGGHLSAFDKAVKRFHLRNKTVAERLKSCSSFIDEFIAALLRKLQTTNDDVATIFDFIESLKEKMNNLKAHKHEQEITISQLEKDGMTLLSACTYATQELQFDCKNSLLQLAFLPELRQLELVFSQGIPVQDGQLSFEGSKYGKEAEMLFLVTRKAKALCKQFESTADVASSTITNLLNELKEARRTCEEVNAESVVKQKTVSKLAAEVEALQTSCNELRLLSEAYQAKEVKLRESESVVEMLQQSCNELKLLKHDYKAKEVQLRESEAKLEAKEVKLRESEAELEAIQRSCNELKLLTQDYRAKEEQLRESEAELEANKVKLRESEAEVEALLQRSCNELKLLTQDYRAKEEHLGECEAELEAKEVQLRESEAEVEVLQQSCNELKLLTQDYKAKEVQLRESEAKLEAKEVKLRESEAEVEALQRSCDELRLLAEDYQAKEVKLRESEAEVEALQKSCNALKLVIEDYKAKEYSLKEREMEASSLHNALLMKEQEALLSANQVSALIEKIKEIDVPMVESEAGVLESGNSILVKQLFYIIDNVTDLQNRISSLCNEKEELHSTIGSQTHEIELLKEEIENHFRNEEDATETTKSEMSEVIFGLDKIIGILGGDSLVINKNSSGAKGLLSVLEKQVLSLLLEYESSKSKAQDLGSKLVVSQKSVDELLAKVKFLEESLQARPPPEILQERSLFEGPSFSTGPEISEIEDAGPIGKSAISPVPSAAQLRVMRKGSTDHLALDIDSESSRLIIDKETDDDKGRLFKSLNTSGLVPKQGKLIADRVDGICVSGGRILMNRPRARLGAIAYCILLHIWLLGTIL